jgi:glycosyltransferase involved in cell wall biosynthesis
MTTTFSVITCTRNSAGTLPATLRSILQQRGASFEQVFVDGGSTDGTLELLRAVPGQTTLLTDVSGGISKAMNAGIGAARGRIIAHLHSDDYYLHDEVLARVESCMEKEGSDWLFGRIVSDIDGKLVPEGFHVPRVDPMRLLRRNLVPHAATFVRREVFEKFGGFREDYRLAMDYEFWLRIARQTKVSQLEEALAAFRVHPESATRKFAWRSFNEDFRARFSHAPLRLWPEFALRYVVRAGRQWAGV